ncbi:hypothetical protein TNCV_2931351 [Trichonephila clavipes]|nr:hypothetical protein TNCV_2931351 [Trichonephila clavipes]
MLGSRKDLHIFEAGSVNGTRYCNEILLPYVRFLEALWVCSSFHGRQCTMSSYSSCRKALRVRILYDWPASISGSQSHRACMGLSRQTLGSSYLTTSNDSSFDWRCKTNGQQCLNNSLTSSFSAWVDAVKPA